MGTLQKEEATHIERPVGNDRVGFVMSQFVFGEHPIDKPLVHFLEDVSAVHGRLLNARECTAELGEQRVYHWATILVEDIDNLA